MLDLHLLFGKSIPQASERLKLICYTYGTKGLDKETLKNKYSEFHLPEIKNWSRDFTNLKSNSETFVKNGAVFLSPDTKIRIGKEYASFAIQEDKFEIGNFGNFNNLSDNEVEAARNMSKLYFQLHLFENSVRKFMETVFSNKFGEDWWSKVANASNKNKHKNRLEKERDQKWLPSRTEKGPLYSLDWIDLVNMMIRKEELFEPWFPDTTFFYRFKDVYGLRNVIAHNGDFDDDDSLLRINLAIKDWIKQTEK